MKSFNKKDVFTLVTAEEAKAYIGKQGYFGDSFGELEDDIKKGCSGNLVGVFPDRYTSTVFKPYASDTSYGLFLPVDKLKEVEKPKRWRPFRSFKEFSETLNKGIGSEITYRNKDYPLRIITTTIISFIEEANREDQIQIGGGTLKFSTWFKEIEIFNGKDWQPFGVLSDENA